MFRRGQAAVAALMLLDGSLPGRAFTSKKGENPLCYSLKFPRKNIHKADWGDRALTPEALMPKVKPKPCDKPSQPQPENPLPPSPANPPEVILFPDLVYPTFEVGLNGGRNVGATVSPGIQWQHSSLVAGFALIADFGNFSRGTNWLVSPEADIGYQLGSFTPFFGIGPAAGNLNSDGANVEKIGFSFSAGLQYNFTPDWSLVTRYRHYDLGNAMVNASSSHVELNRFEFGVTHAFIMP